MSLRTKFRLSTVVDVVEMIAALGVAVSAVVAVRQYWKSEGDKHVEQSFKFIERFEDDRLETAQRTIDQIAAKASETADQAVDEKSVAKLSARERESMRDRVFVEAVIASNGTADVDVPTSAIEITSFFNGLQVCIERQLCDGSVAHAFLDSYAISFWKTYRPIIRYAREGNRPQFASGMERFIRSSVGINA
jgi:hypothetical protein